MKLITEQKLANGALLEGLGQDANPYPEGTAEWLAWDVSWAVGRMWQAIEAGSRARVEGKPISDCPADLEKLFSQVWRMGWEGKVKPRTR